MNINPESIMVALLEDASDSIGDQDVIARLAHDNQVFRSALVVASEKIHGQQEMISGLDKLLEEERKNSISKATIAKMIVKFFQDGDIPVPEKIVKESKGLLSVSCHSDDISTVFCGVVRASVMVTTPTRGDDRISFYFGLIPEMENGNTRARYYPDFHMGYTKVAPVAPAKKRVRVRNAKVKGNPSSTNALP